jgi:hypothetical protein
MKKYGTVGVSHPLKEALRKLSFETEAYSMNTLIHAMYILAQQHKGELKEIIDYIKLKSYEEKVCEIKNIQKKN